MVLRCGWNDHGPIEINVAAQTSWSRARRCRHISKQSEVMFFNHIIKVKYLITGALIPIYTCAPACPVRSASTMKNGDVFMTSPIEAPIPL